MNENTQPLDDPTSEEVSPPIAETAKPDEPSTEAVPATVSTEKKPSDRDTLPWAAWTEIARDPLWIALTIACLGLVLFVALIFLNTNMFQPAPKAVVIQPQTSHFVTVTPTLDPTIYPALGESNIIATPTPISLTIPQSNQPYYADANEMGKVIVFMYHRIMYPEGRYQRTPENFRADLQQLYQRGYYPVNFVDLLRGLPDVPPGKKPIVLTFDDSDLTQFEVFADNTINASSAVGIMLDFHNEHKDEWPMRSTFFVLADDRDDYYRIFGQSFYAKAKLKFLRDMGMEVGSHTVTHADLSVTTEERIYWELAVSHHVLEDLMPGYQVETLAVPFGGFPYTLDFLHSGQWGDYRYDYSANAAAWGGPSVSPHDAEFDRYKVPRVEVSSEYFDYWLTYFDEHPEEYYISDGDPNRFTYTPVELTEAQ